RQLAQRGIAEAIEFARPRAPRPMLITADEGQIPDSVFRGPSFASVRSSADTVADTKTMAEQASAGPQRRGAPRTNVAPGADRIVAPEIAGPEAEGERQERLKAVTRAISDMKI